MSKSCPNHPRRSQHHPNPPPGSSREAASAANNDAKKRDGGVVGVLKMAYNKMMSTAPSVVAAGSPQSAAAMADKKDQAKQITPDAK
jgi:hypothetical protein